MGGEGAILIPHNFRARLTLAVAERQDMQPQILYRLCHNDVLR